MITVILNKMTDGATSFIAPKRAGWRSRLVSSFRQTYLPFALVGYEVIITNSRYALVGYFITSYPTRAHGIIVIYHIIIIVVVIFIVIIIIISFQ